ncbi:MAG: DUF6470 family protein [Bacillota bacterium]|nr:DUF6470 family protein [Bacillota bacterium]
MRVEGPQPFLFGTGREPLLRVGRLWPPRVEIRQERAQLELEREPLRLSIDQRQTFKEIGLYTIWMRMDELVQQGREAALEGIGRWSAEGDRLMRIESGENAIAAIAAESWPAPPETNVALVPQTPPQIRVEGGRLRVEVRPAKLEISWRLEVRGWRLGVRS